MSQPPVEQKIASGLDLQSISPPPQPSGYALDKAHAEIEHYKKRKRLERENYRQNMEERKRYAQSLFQLISLWLLAVGLMIFGYGYVGGPFKPSENVVLALIGGTTANVLGLFYIVTRYLFPTPKEKKDTKD